MPWYRSAAVEIQDGFHMMVMYFRFPDTNSMCPIAPGSGECPKPYLLSPNRHESPALNQYRLKDVRPRAQCPGSCLVGILQPGTTCTQSAEREAEHSTGLPTADTSAFRHLHRNASVSLALVCWSPFGNPSGTFEQLPEARKPNFRLVR